MNSDPRSDDGNRRLRIAQSCDNEDGPSGVGSTSPSLTHSLDYGEEGLPVNGTRRRQPCTIEGCEALQHRRGYCHPHYNRFKRFGDPLAGRARRGEALAYFEAHVTDETDDCIVWPWVRKDGAYGWLYLDGKRVGVHALACERAHGPRPDGAVVAHAPVVCHNPSCFNPRHLRWATQAENSADRWLDGTVPSFKREAS